MGKYQGRLEIYGHQPKSMPLLPSGGKVRWLKTIKRQRFFGVKNFFMVFSLNKHF